MMSCSTTDDTRMFLIKKSLERITAYENTIRTCIILKHNNIRNKLNY